MEARAAAARPVLPDLKIAALDPFGLRYLTLSAFVIALIFGSGSKSDELAALMGGGVKTDLGSALGGPIYEGWIEPPRYTGLPAIYLNKATGTAPLQVPQGSKVTIRLYGQVGDLDLLETLSGTPPRNPDAEGANSQTDQAGTDAKADTAERIFNVTQSGTIRLNPRHGEAVNWQVAMIPDLPPDIAIAGIAERGAQGEMRLPYSASDDYGVVRGEVRIALDLASVPRRFGLALPPEQQADIQFELPLPLNGKVTKFSETVVNDLSKSPWAGLPVQVTLLAEDALQQATKSASRRMLLPGRRFFDPTAAALVEQRRDLLWNRANAPRVAQVLRAISYKPETGFDNKKAYLLTRSVIRRLELNASAPLSDALRDQVAEMLWKAALQIEDGDLSDAEKRLKRAQDRLSEALKNGATEDEIAKLTQELSRAMQDYLQKLARDAENDPAQQQAQNGETRQITQDQLQKMLDRIQELQKQGRNAEAQQLLDQLNEMMKNITTAKRQQGQGQGQQAMRDLQDTLRQQQDLSDEAFKKLQEQFNQERGSAGRGQEGQGNQGDPGTAPLGSPGGESNQAENGTPRALSQEELTKRQESLRQLLQSQRQGLPDGNSPQGREALKSLERAERNMGRASRDLAEGNLSGALDKQAQALDALREGIDNMDRAMAGSQNDGAGQQGSQAGRPDPNSRNDPLGRQAGSVGRLGSSDPLASGPDSSKRARELLDEIRRRSGDRSRPKMERDYLERLLDRF